MRSLTRMAIGAGAPAGPVAVAMDGPPRATASAARRTATDYEPRRRNMARYAAIFILMAAVAIGHAGEPAADTSRSALLFSYFKGNGEDGLHLAYSRDGLTWVALKNDASFLKPEVGGRLMRDPCICQGPDGLFHMVWTSGWWDKGIGIAHSKDLVTWSEQAWLPVMAHEPNAANCWAPEIFYDADEGRYLIFWSTTIAGRFPETATGGDKNKQGIVLNHRIYCVTTKDFLTYTRAKLFYDDGFNAIDATIVRDGDRHIMFIKDETRWPEPEKNIRIAFSEKAAGPYGQASEPFSPDWVEGPTAIKIGDEWFVYYDAYRRGHFEGAKSRDLTHWEPITDRLSFPKGARHGTVLAVSDEILDNLLEPAPAKITIGVHADQPGGPLTPIWQFFGYDEANYTYAPDGNDMLAKIAELGAPPAFIRAHHLLTSGDGDTWLKWSSTNLYDEDDQGNPVYNWSIIDRIFDTILYHRLKPYVEIGFMPEALTVHPEDYTPPRVLQGRPRGSVGGGAFYPPRDYGKWQTLIETWVKHCVQRYGRKEVLTWYWELWNEPDIAYWKGSSEEYLRLYDHTAAAIKDVLPQARVGGPHVTNPTSRNSEALFRKFIEHCLRGTNHVTGRTGTPLDVVAFHTKGGTEVVNGRARMNMPNHLRTIDRGCAIVASYPELRRTPIVVGESDPDGCAACSSEYYPQNAYRNGAQYASYTAATFLREQAIAERHGVNLQGSLTWAFVFPDQPYFAGYRTLATHGLAKPVFNAFRMFSLLERQRVGVTNSTSRSLDDLMKPQTRATPDIDAIATRGERAVTAIVWHHHDDNRIGPSQSVSLDIAGLPDGIAEATLRHYRIDDFHSNAYTAWQIMASPQAPSPAQIATLKRASELTLFEPARSVKVTAGRVSVQVEMPRHSISLLRLEW